jgi:hypothetical protein
MIPAAKVWPNGEFTLGYAWDGEGIKPADELWLPEVDLSLSPNELDERLEAMHELLDEVTAAYSVSGRLAWRLLTLSNAPNSHEPTESVKYGLHGLTGTGAKMLRSACFLMEEKFGKEDVTMATFTVPRLSQAERVLVAQGWGVLTNRLVQYLKRELVEQGRPPLICGCVEIQSSRLESRAEGYLHLHLIWPAHSNNGRRWAVKAENARAWWKAALERIIGRDLPCLPRIETAIVETSVEHYMGKYLSKGSDDCLGQFVADLGYESVPGQWWFASAEMKRWVKENTLGGRNLGALLESYIEHTVTLGTGASFQWLRHVDLPLDGRLITVGYVGRLSRETKAELDLLMKTG